MVNLGPQGGVGARQWLVVGLVAIGLAGCKQDEPVNISGEPATSVDVGASYSFEPTASVRDGKGAGQLTFTIENKPVWASFNEATGALAGTPTAADVGTFSNIVIAVSDGTASAALPAFSIDVTQAQAATGSVTLSWIPPTQNADGSALTNLAGYHIYYGTDSANLSQKVELKNPGLSKYVVESLSPATWHFAMTAFNSKAEESAQIGVVSVTVR